MTCESQNNLNWMHMAASCICPITQTQSPSTLSLIWSVRLQVYVKAVWEFTHWLPSQLQKLRHICSYIYLLYAFLYSCGYFSFLLARQTDIINRGKLFSAAKSCISFFNTFSHLLIVLLHCHPVKNYCWRLQTTMLRHTAQVCWPVVTIRKLAFRNVMQPLLESMHVVRKWLQKSCGQLTVLICNRVIIL